MFGVASGPGVLQLFAVKRPVLVCWLLIGAMTTVPYMVAALAPPPGRTFVGTFHWIDDFYNYVSFVQQAEDGHLLLQNKLLLEEHPPVLVNLEWWAVGGLSRLFGRRPFLAYRLFSLAVLAAFLLAANRALQRLQIPSRQTLPALLLVATGGGFGGLLFDLTPREIFRCADLYVGIFPWLEILGNPHWLAGTWLLLETLLAFDRPSPTGPLRALGVGTALGLVRPYDLVIVALVQALSVCLSAPLRAWPRRFVPLLGFVPVACYNYWVFYGISTFRGYGTTSYEMPPRADFVWALGPAALAALTTLWVPARDSEEQALRLKLWLWAGLIGVAIIVRPVSFTMQFTVGAGLPLLLLACAGLANARRWVLPVLLVAFSTTAVVALRIAFQSDPNWHVPAERKMAAVAMRPSCRPGDIAFSPPDIGLYTIGLTACRAFVSHSWAPGHGERLTQVRSFYGAMPPAERIALLDRLHISHLVLPDDAGPAAAAWLGEGSSFRQIARLAPFPGGASVYVRAR